MEQAVHDLLPQPGDHPASEDFPAYAPEVTAEQCLEAFRAGEKGRSGLIIPASGPLQEAYNSGVAYSAGRAASSLPDRREFISLPPPVYEAFAVGFYSR